MAPPRPPQAEPPRRPGSGGGVVVVVPSLGASHLAPCLAAVAALEPAPDRTVVVLSGAAGPPADAAWAMIIRRPQRLGFAAAVNLGIREGCRGADRIALLNDDAVPPADWLGRLGRALDADPRRAAVQGTITNASGELVDGRGITIDRYGLPVQVDRGLAAAAEPAADRDVLAVSGTAALLRSEALRQASLGGGEVLDPCYGSYHDDLDLGLRLRRLGWSAVWVAGAPTRHVGSTTGRGYGWRHPWWLLANRWRALAGNLTRAALLGALPCLLRGELRAVHTLLRGNPRTAIVALAVLTSVPVLVASGWRRRSPGPRLEILPGRP